jgi:uncharacterized membrane protein
VSKKNKKQSKPADLDSSSQSSAPAPLTSAVAATMPIVYSAQIAHSQQISGPLPPPELLKQYDALSPGTAARIIKMAEDEAEHRRRMENEVLAIQSRDQIAYRRSEMLGQAFGLGIGVAAIAGAVIAAVHGAQIAAAFIGTGGVTSLVTAFILGRSFLLKQKQQEFEQQRQLALDRRAEDKSIQDAP